MRKLIFNAIAFSDNGPVTVQMKEVANVYNVYLQNSFVCLKSIQLLNPDVDVCLISNRELKEEYQRLFFENGITVTVIDHNSYKMPDSFQWQLAFFKLCALEYAVSNMDYDMFAMLDADVYCTKSLDDFWKEWNAESLLLYNLPSTYTEPTRKEIIDGYAGIYQEEKSIVNYGGELVAGSKALLQKFLETCGQIHADVIRNTGKVSKNIGDEFILSAAIGRQRYHVISANAYLDRYWTGRSYQCSTSYNTTALWHMPAEKSYTFVKLFRYCRKHKAFPPNETVANWAGLPKRSRSHALPFYWHRLKEKYAKRLSR